MKTILTTALLTGALAAQSTQGPDVLIPSGSFDGTFALSDRNGDGKYDQDGEAWDYIIDGVDSSPRKVVRVGTKLFWIDTKLDSILVAEDTNGNGRIETAERGVYFDAGAAWGASEPNNLVADKNGALWFTNDSGSNEGIYRSVDLNNDGDAEDAGETTAGVAEPAQVVVANTTNSPTLSVTALDSIAYDPTGNGRFLCEEENFDQTIAFEDKNNDGDFLDAGEVYLFVALGNFGTLQPDVNPDVVSNLLPSCNEMSFLAVDASGATPVYYMLSRESSSSQTDAAVLFRATDNNNDGDVNDAGETKLFWDGSLDTMGANGGYNFFYGVAVTGGKVFVTAEFDGSPDQEHLVALEDKNADNDANDAGELTVVWVYDADRTHYEPTLLAAGTLKAPVGLPGQWENFGNRTCVTGNSGNHGMVVGSTNYDDKVVLGESFTLRTFSTAASSGGVHVLGNSRLTAGFPLDTNGTCNIYVGLTVLLTAFPFSTTAAGDFNQAIPLPNDTSNIGVELVWQSAVLDSAAPAAIGLTISDGVATRIGGYSYTRQ